MEDSDKKIDIKDFYYKSLVMDILKKCTEAGSDELIAGWYNEKLNPDGSVIKTYIKDTRMKFIETVKTAINVMCCKFDKKAEKNIYFLLEELEKKEKKLLKEQWDWYNNLEPNPKGQWSGKIMPDLFHKELLWYIYYTKLEIETYRNILSELYLLAKREDFFRMI